MAQHICAIDLGTSRLKAAFFDDKGRASPMASTPAPPVAPGTGEFDAESYFAAILETITKAAASAGDIATTLCGLTCSCQRATLVLTDDEDQPIAPAFSWQGTDCAAAGDAFFQRIGAERFREITGLLPSAIYPAAKLAWLRQRSPELLRDAATIQTLQDWVFRRLGAHDRVTERSSASSTGLFDLQAERWSRELLDALDIEISQLPQMTVTTETVGTLAGYIVTELGLPPNVPLILGGADQQCARLGAGVQAVGEAMVSLGTSAAVQLAIAQLASPAAVGDGMLCGADVLPNRWILEGFQRSWGSAVGWAASTLGLEDAARLEEAAGDAVVDESAPFFVPFLEGSGTPEFDDAVRGAWLGVSLATERRHLALALFEGLAFEARRILEVIEATVTIDGLYVVGGGGGRLAVQLLADVTGREVSVVDVAEAALVGAAKLAWKGLDARASTAWGNQATIIAPQAGDNAMVERRFGRYLRAVESVHQWHNAESITQT